LGTREIQSRHEDEECQDWQDAVDLELETLRNNRTWIAEDKPENVCPLYSKWVFKRKVDADGGIEPASLLAAMNNKKA
jgi:hypothetical protein